MKLINIVNKDGSLICRFVDFNLLYLLTRPFIILIYDFINLVEHLLVFITDNNIISLSHARLHRIDWPTDNSIRQIMAKLASRPC